MKNIIFLLFIFIFANGVSAQAPSSPDDVASFNADLSIAIDYSANDFSSLQRNKITSATDALDCLKLMQKDKVFCKPLSDSAYDEMMSVLANASYSPENKKNYAFISQSDNDKTLLAIQSLSQQTHVKVEGEIEAQLAQAGFSKLVDFYWLESDYQVQKATLNTLLAILNPKNSPRIGDTTFQHELFSSLLFATTPSELAFKIMRRMVAINPQDSELAFALAHAQFIKNNLESALNNSQDSQNTQKILSELTNFQKKFPQDAALASLDLAYHELVDKNQPDLALQTLESALKLEKHKIQTAIYTAKVHLYAWSRQGFDEAGVIQHAKKAASLLHLHWQSDNLDMASSLILAKIYYRLNDWENAKNILKNLATSYDDFEAWIGLGLCEWHLNQPAQALYNFNKAQNKAVNTEQKERASRLIQFAN